MIRIPRIPQFKVNLGGDIGNPTRVAQKKDEKNRALKGLEKYKNDLEKSLVQTEAEISKWQSKEV